MLVMHGHIEGHLNYILSMHNTSYSGVHIIPFRIQNGIAGLKVNTSTGTKLQGVPINMGIQ